MINRDKMEHILEYAKQQRHVGLRCNIPPDDMVEIMERLLQAGNSPQSTKCKTVDELLACVPLNTGRSRGHFISLCNEFWNWSEMDLVCADDRGYELRMEWDGKVFKHPVTQALWRMYQAATVNSPVIPDGSASMLQRWLAFGRGMQNAGSQLPRNLIAETESMLAAAPQEPKS